MGLKETVTETRLSSRNISRFQHISPVNNVMSREVSRFLPFSTGVGGGHPEIWMFRFLSFLIYVWVAP